MLIRYRTARRFMLSFPGARHRKEKIGDRGKERVEGSLRGFDPDTIHGRTRIRRAEEISAGGYDFKFHDTERVPVTERKTERKKTKPDVKKDKEKDSGKVDDDAGDLGSIAP